MNLPTVLVDRKELAQLLNVSPDQVRRNEVRWGLSQAKVILNRKTVRYYKRVALLILKRRGFIES